MNKIAVLTEKLKKSYKVNKTHRHNTRVDGPKVSYGSPDLNQRLIGHEKGLQKAINDRIRECDITPRSNAVLAQQLIVIASPEFFRPDYDRFDPKGFGKYEDDRVDQFKERALKAMKEMYGEKNIISFDVHLDERTPHIHAVVTPIIEKELKQRESKRQKQERLARGESAPIKKKMCLDANTVFGKDAHENLQENFAAYFKDVGLEAGVKHSITKKKHESHHDFNERLAISVMERDDIEELEIIQPNIREQKTGFLGFGGESDEEYRQYLKGIFDEYLSEQKDTWDFYLKNVEKEHRYNKFVQEETLKKLEQMEKAITELAEANNITVDLKTLFSRIGTESVPEFKDDAIEKRNVPEGIKVKKKNNRSFNPSPQ